MLPCPATMLDMLFTYYLMFGKAMTSPGVLSSERPEKVIGSETDRSDPWRMAGCQPRLQANSRKLVVATSLPNTA